MKLCEDWTRPIRKFYVNKKVTIKPKWENTILLKNSVAVDINEYKCVFVVLRVVKCISVCIMLKSGALFLSKYMASQMGISREKTTTVKTLFAAQLDKIPNS